MNLTEAKAECQRWLDYLKLQEEKSLGLQMLASERRRGIVTADEAKARMRAIDDRMSLRVYDGAKLAEAVAYLVRHC